MQVIAKSKQICLWLGFVTPVVFLVSFLAILLNRVSQPRRERNGTVHRRGPLLTRAARGSPPVFRGIDRAAANVINADLPTEQVVDVYGYQSGRVGNYIFSFVVDQITVPVTGETPKTLIPVGPGVAASSVSA